MQQITIDDLLTQAKENYTEQVKRLVPLHYMTNLEWRFYEYLTNNCLTYKKRVSMSELAEIFNVNMREVRKVIETLKLKQVAKIGTVNGYYIMSLKEYQKELSAAKSRIEKSITVFESRFPEEKNFLHAVVHRNKKEWLATGQSQIQFTGHERVFIRQFAEDYLK